MLLCGKTTPQLKFQRFPKLLKSVFRKSVPIHLRFSEPLNANKENPFHQRSAKRTRFIRVPTTTASRTSASVILVPKTNSRTSTTSKTNPRISKISPIIKIRDPKKTATSCCHIERSRDHQTQRSQNCHVERSRDHHIERMPVPNYRNRELVIRNSFQNPLQSSPPFYPVKPTFTKQHSKKYAA